jgi:hypothetical protein
MYLLTVMLLYILYYDQTQAVNNEPRVDELSLDSVYFTKQQILWNTI